MVGLVLGGCFGRASGPATSGRWVEEMTSPTASLRSLGGSAELGVYAGARGLYRREAGQWALVPGTDAHVWNDMAVVGSELWAVGESGGVLRLGPGGAVQQAEVEGVPSAFYNVSSAQGAVYANAADERLWRWDGASWAVSTPGELTGHTLGAMFALGPDRVIAHVPPKSTGKALHMGSLDGGRWTVETRGKRWAYVASMRGAGPDAVWAVGMAHAGLFGKTGFAMRWDGARWVDEALPVSVPLNDVSVRGPTDAVAVGQQGTLLRWDGRAWSTLATGGKLPFTRVFAAPDGQIYVVENGARLLRWDGGSP